jgi:hypothetical protein
MFEFLTTLVICVNKSLSEVDRDPQHTLSADQPSFGRVSVGIS